MSKTSRRTFLRMAPAAAVLTAIGRAADGGPEPSPTTLWYQQPATRWEEALAIGNGRLGAMIFGGIEKERLQLNEITVWFGRLEPDQNRPDAYKSLPAIRQLIQDGKYAEAGKAMNEQRTCLKEGRAAAGTYGSYQGLGDLNFELAPLSGTPTAYRRWLDIGEAVAGVSFKVGEDTWTRELFSSATGWRRSQEPGTARGRRHRLEQGLEDQLLGAAARWRSCLPPGARATHRGGQYTDQLPARRRHVFEPV